jgi:Cysteine-rich secretory protein family
MPSAITDGMYNKEFENYKDFWGKDEVAWESGPGMWGHMTQIVWRETTEVGCATFKCPQPVASANPDFPPYSSVCNYYPPGNVMGHFTSVGTPLGKPVVIVDADAYKY